MFTKPAVETPELDTEIARIFEWLQDHDPSSDAYAKMVDQLIKLRTLKDSTNPERLSTDAKATIIANLTGLLLILNYERANVFTSKAAQFLMKLR